MKQEFTLSVNGVARKVSCNADMNLIDVLRCELNLTGTKRGCGIGACGACTVLIDGRPRRSCRVKIGEIAFAPGPGTGDRAAIFQVPNPESPVPNPQSRVPIITTIEGLEADGRLHPIQQAFIDCGAIQCGFCTPGMVMSTKALLDSNPRPSREEIKRALAANLCRCTGYRQIFEAVEKAALDLSSVSESKRRGGS